MTDAAVQFVPDEPDDASGDVYVRAGPPSTATPASAIDKLRSAMSSQPNPTTEAGTPTTSADTAMAKIRAALGNDADTSSSSGAPPASAADTAMSKIQTLLSGNPLPSSPAPPPVPESRKATLTSTIGEIGSGLSQGAINAVGLPFDLAAGVENLGIRGINALTGSNIRPAEGGSQRLSELFGLADPRMNPENNPPQNLAESIARGAGAGAGGAAILPGVAGGLGALGLSGAPMQAASAAAGPLSASNIAVNTAAGAGGEAAASLVPDRYKPMAQLAGSLAAGGAATPLTEIPTVARAGANSAKQFVAPMTDTGRQQLAADTFARGVADPAKAKASLDAYQGPKVPGSNLTTAQVTGDIGVGSMERAAETANPVPFNVRRAEQGDARGSAIKGLQPTGDPAKVAEYVRSQMAALDAVGGAAEGSATDATGKLTSGIGQASGATPEAQGNAMRTALAKSNAEAKAREKALWGAVDPDNKLSMASGGVTKAATSISKSLPSTAKPMSGEEAAIFQTAAHLPAVSMFGDITALRSRVSAAMRQELMTAGQTPTYGRLSQLRGAIEDAISDAAAHKAAQDETAVAAGELPAGESLGSRWSNGAGAEEGPASGVSARKASADVATAEKAVGNRSLGANGARDAGLRDNAGDQGISRSQPGPDRQVLGPGKVYHPSGSLDVNYELANLPDLVTSHDTNFRVNKAYPANLQPRAREQAPAQDQVNGMASRLQPERLGRSPEANSGAPIVGPDNVVESGNGRTLALSKAYAAGRGGDYRQWLASQGIDTTGIKNPVLIARRVSELSPADRVAFAHSANTASGLAMTDGEKAFADARLISPASLGHLAGTSLASSENQPFVRSFLAQLPATERADLLDAQGALSQKGLRRLELAMMAKAYGDGDFIDKAFVARDLNVRGLAGALTDAAPAWSNMRDAAREGVIDSGHDVTPALMTAARGIVRAREAGRPISEVLNQGDMFGDEASSLAKGFLVNAKGQLASREQIAANLRNYANEAQKNLAAPGLFGDTVSPAQVLRTTLAKTGSADEPASVSAAMKGPLAANMDEDALERLNAATKATKARATTFGQGAVGDALRTQGQQGNYRLLDSAVGAKFFKPGPGGADAVNAFKKAAGSDPEAMRALEGYAGLSLRKAAIKPDGTLDPAKFAAWQRAHGDALRAMPDVAAKFADAAKASEAVADAGAAKAEALDAYQQGAIAKVMDMKDPESVTNAVGRIFQQPDAIGEMRKLAQAVKSNPEARDGLRKAIADHLVTKALSTTGDVKADTFQRFVRDNRPVIAQAFSADEFKGIEAVAAELARVNRAAKQASLPGRSNTAMDLLSQKPTSGHNLSLFAEMMIGGNTGFDTAGLRGAIAGAGAAVGKQLVLSARAAGMETVKDLIRGMLLHPELAKAALERANLAGDASLKQQALASARRLQAQLARVATLTANRMVSQPQD